MTLLGCVLLAAACADLGGVPGDATRATIDSAAARDHGSEATPSASPSPSLAERIAYRPPGCPEPLPPMPEEALEAYAGTCLVPEVWGRLDDAPGFMDGGMIDPTVSDDIYVYWSGEVDPASQAAIDQAALDGVHVEVRYVRFSEDQHSAATSAIVSALTDAAIGWSAVGPGEGFETIRVVIRDSARIDEARRVAQAAAGEIPVRIEVGDYEHLDARDDGAAPPPWIDRA